MANYKLPILNSIETKLLEKWEEAEEVHEITQLSNQLMKVITEKTETKQFIDERIEKLFEGKVKKGFAFGSSSQEMNLDLRERKQALSALSEAGIIPGDF